MDDYEASLYNEKDTLYIRNNPKTSLLWDWKYNIDLKRYYVWTEKHGWAETEEEEVPDFIKLRFSLGA